jgi:hypothetical protein
MSINTIMKFRVILFKTVSAAMKAEKMLLSAGVPHKLIPVPKSISSDCGICLRYDINNEAEILKSINEEIDFFEVRDI